MFPNSLIILDRDGVLNHMVVNPEHGIVDSPLHPDQVQVDLKTAQALCDLQKMGFELAVATNQPAAAKGKTTFENLKAVHSKVLELLEATDFLQNKSYICWHKKEDNCECRKPKAGLLLKALTEAHADPSKSWMIGDGVTDLVAGKLAGVKTAFIGPRKTDVCKIFQEHNVEPDLWCSDLSDFTKQIANKN